MSKTLSEKIASLGIALLCFGYFASYIPYSMMTKMITKGLFPSMNGVGFSGFEIQPVVVAASVIAMLTFLTVAGWWKYATQSKVLGVSIPRPQWFTLISGVCTGGVIITTTLAYTFSGISIVFAMLLMRGGVLLLAPLVDAVVKNRKRAIAWPSWVAAGLSLSALLVAFMGKASTAITVIAAVDIGIYLVSYFFRFYFMGSRAKSSDESEKKRYFVEEQLTAQVFLIILLAVVGYIGSTMGAETIPGKIWAGMTLFPSSGYVGHALLIGFFSYGTGLFGSLILLDKREHTFCVPANRCSSIVSGVIATYLLAFFLGQKFPSSDQIIGVTLIFLAIVFLSVRAIQDKKKAKVKATEKSTTPMKCCCTEAE